MDEEKPKKKRKKVAAEDGGAKEHKKNWREVYASVGDIKAVELRDRRHRLAAHLRPRRELTLGGAVAGEARPFTGTWQLRYWSPEGNGGEKRNCLQLTATYDDAARDYMAYSCTLTFAYADATTLRIQGYYVKDPDGWINYQRGEAEPSI